MYIHVRSVIPILSRFVTFKSWDFPCCLLTRRQKLGPFISSFLSSFSVPYWGQSQLKLAASPDVAHTRTHKHTIVEFYL